MARLRLKANGVVALEVGGKPTLADVADDLVVAIEIADCSAVDDVVETELTGVDSGRHRSDGLNVGLADLGIVDKLIEPFGL